MSIKKCEFCSISFKGRNQSKFCSDYCRMSIHSNTKSKLICINCGEEKHRTEFIKSTLCIKCFSKANPKWIKKKKESIPYFIEIETFLKKIQAQKYKARYEDMLMIVHYHAEIDYFSTMTIDDMFIDLQNWYIQQKRKLFK